MDVLIPSRQQGVFMNLLTHKEIFMQANLQRAAEFIQTNGNDVEQARLARILTGEKPPREMIVKLFAGQRLDGGWSPFWAPDYSSIDATCYRLAQADQLGVGMDYPAAQQACLFLAKQQQVDGRLEESATVADVAPPWAAPGDLAATLYLTANVGFWLAACCDNEAAASRAASFLLPHVGLDGRMPSFLHTHWLTVGLLLVVEPDEIAVDRICAQLSRKINVETAPSQLAWLASTLLVAGVSCDHPLLVQARSLLAVTQQADGHWVSEDGPELNVHTTLEALRVLIAQ